MSIESRLALVFGLLAMAIVTGLLWRAKTGRAKKVEGGEQIDLAEIGAIKNGKPVTAFGKKVTFLQFSSEFCTACRQTARLYSELELVHPEILHIEVDITNRVDLANKFNILQTPTTLVLDSRGRVTSRIGGAVKQQTIKDEIGSFTI
jgi:thiol-disulfide isomerase/thioredoxin